MSLIFSILTNKNKGYTYMYMNTYKILVLLLMYLKYEKNVCTYMYVISNNILSKTNGYVRISSGTSLQ